MPIDRFKLFQRSALSRSLTGLALLALSSSCLLAQQTSPSRVRGTIEGVDGDVLSVKSRAGEDVKLHMTADLRVVGITKISPVGSAGLKAAHVADGRADVYLQPGRAGKRWDCCAPEAIVVAAGGVFTDAHGEAFGYGGPELTNNKGFLATNGKLHERVLEQLREARG